MKRRAFIGLLGGAAAWPVVALAQQAPMRVIRFLNSASADPDAARVQGFRLGLRESGHVVSENVAIEYRWADNHNERLPDMAADLVRRQVSAIAAFGIPPV